MSSEQVASSPRKTVNLVTLLRKQINREGRVKTIQIASIQQRAEMIRCAFLFALLALAGTGLIKVSEIPVVHNTRCLGQVPAPER